MEIYRTRIDTIRNYNLDPNEVIKGLNGYYESDKRNGYITVMRNDYEGPAYFTAALYLSALIEWLREDHDIFYRPGLIFDQIEAARSAAKMCCLRAHIKDEISKRELWCGADEDVPALVDTLFKAYDECVERANKNRKDAVKLSKEIRCVVKEKDRSFAILQDLYRDIVKKQPDGLSAEDIANKILDRVLTTEDLLHKSVDSVNKECKATGKLMVEDYEFKLKNYILKDIKKHGYRYDSLETKSIEEIVDRIIQIATCPRNEWANCEIENLRGQISRLKDLINVMNKEVGDM